ncbi:MAG: HaeIII family restriction endonuclease [Paludibacter sp.]
MNQVENGKAFEYSIAKNYFDHLVSLNINVELVENKSLDIAKGFYEKVTKKEQERFDIAAKNTIETLLVIEPGLIAQKGNTDILKIHLATDVQGQLGDVRDVVFHRENSKPQWEIGISAKNNHEAVKHSRLSPTINFGRDWLGHSCSDQYFIEINQVFSFIKDQMNTNEIMTWNDLGETKVYDVYLPILMSFRRELLRLSNTYKDVPSRLLSYLIGRKPFYKIIKDDRNNLVIVKAFNLGGELNKTVAGIKPRASTEKIKFPTRIIELELKENSDNTLMMVLDEGWQISFRIHNASSLLETSLKFDINLIGNPPILFTQHLFVLE